MLPIKKIYIDSRCKSSDSISDSDFQIDLPTTFLMPEDTGFYIDDVCIPHTWYPIEEDVNNWLICRISNYAVPLNIQIPEGNYSVKDLGLAIVSGMNYAVGLGEVFLESVYDARRNTITIKPAAAHPSVQFLIWTDEQLELQGSPYAGKTINSILKNDVQKQFNNTPFVTGYVDMYPLRNIYMTSSGLGNFNTMTITGNRNVIKKIPVSAAHGEIIFDQVVAGMDYLDCSRQTLSRISFKLIDIYGTVIDLHDNHISFSIVFPGFKTEVELFSGS